MPALPSSLGLTSIPDSAAIIAADHRNNYAAIQTAANALIAALSGGTAGQFLTATSSTAVAWAGSYTAYTPTLTSNGGGAPALGNAVVTARYLQIGKMVHCYGIITQGTTTNYGTGTLLVAIPVTAATGTAATQGTGSVLHNSTGAQYITAPSLVDTGRFQILIPNGYGGASASVSGSSNYPWAWATSDNIVWNLTYEAA